MPCCRPGSNPASNHGNSDAGYVSCWIFVALKHTSLLVLLSPFWYRSLEKAGTLADLLARSRHG